MTRAAAKRAATAAEKGETRTETWAQITADGTRYSEVEVYGQTVSMDYDLFKVLAVTAGLSQSPQAAPDDAEPVAEPRGGNQPLGAPNRVEVSADQADQPAVQATDGSDQEAT